MNISIQVLSVEVNQATSKQGKPYEQVVVAYKDLSNGGKVASKTIMPFGFQKDTFITMKSAKPVEVFNIEIQKNDAGYNDWIKATKGTAQDTAHTSKATAPTVGATSAKSGGWETPEERAKKQVYIIRQSSLSTAVEALKTGAKVTPSAEDVIKYAKQLESFVFGESAEAVFAQDVGTIETIPEDIPF